MARPPRIEFPNALYLVQARGNRRGAIVLDDEDRWMLIRALGEMAGRTEIRVHAYALMDNHYHFVLETPKANLVAGMRWFQTAYTQRSNAKKGMGGICSEGVTSRSSFRTRMGPIFASSWITCISIPFGRAW